MLKSLQGQIMTKKISIVILLIAIFFKIAIVSIYFRTEEDMLNQVLAARNLIGGHGMTIEQVHIINLSKIVYEPLLGWPPGYSWMVILVYPFTGGNLILCCLLISICMNIAFLVLIWRLVSFLGFPLIVASLIVLFNALVVPDYIRQSTPTDLPACFFCLLSCYLLMIFMSEEKRPGKYGIVLGFFIVLAAYMRYMYLGVCFIIPLFLIWNGTVKKDKRLLSGGMYALSVTGLLVACLIAFQKYYTGNSIYLRPTSKGFFLSNLEYLHPFVLSSIFNLRLYSIQVSRFTHIAYSTVMEITTFIGFVLMLALLYVFVKYSIREKLVAASNHDIFFMTGGLISIFTLALLSFLSITINKNYGLLADGYWTYVSENRYFVFACSFLLLFFCWWLFVNKNSHKNKLLTILRSLFLVAICIEILHGVYLISKYEISDQKGTLPGSMSNQIKEIISQIRKDNAKINRDVVFTSVNNFFCNKITLEGGRCLYNPLELNLPDIGTERPVSLVAILQNRELFFFGDFLRKPGVNRTAVSGKYTFFTYYVDPPDTK
jgi:hypothetical protein